ncbi:N-acetylglucosamine/diacetylchitobiose ABC transporter substrate-binding protein [Catelliglobosispora koreensis]|uniref:N-acetylglucosamine/diacetylchitobiose ABC transporter substrate-binding protein n=1 Tax=Catelliglobosispora koreensis TaxID=129052 RepID=UPI0003753E56|nr:N-acetylglucosamine/diacetylchitobiose ABC transporter substrate-binding protein [Catelliglobosispora koreensis]
MSAEKIRRRTVLGTAAAASLAPAGLLTGCALGSDEGNNQAEGEKNTKNPLGVKEDAPLDVVIFNGGFGEDYAKAHQVMYKESFPKAEVKHTAVVEIGKTLQPRFIEGNPPDFINNSGSNAMDAGKLVAEEQLTDLKELLDVPSLDQPGKTVRQTLLPGAVETGMFDGKMFILNYAYTVYGIWYSKKLFADKGWEYGKTWDDHIALCKKIKASGMAPWTYAGVHPRYMSWPVISTAVKFAGKQVALDIDNLVPNAWQSEGMKMAADAWYQIVKDKYILDGSPGLDHKQSQTEWCKGNAAFISCGSWLENEQAAVTPQGFNMTVAPTPSLGAGDKLPFAAIRGTAGEPYIVPAKAKNPRGGMELMRHMLSMKGAKDFTGKVKSLTIVAGAADGLSFTPGLASCVEAIKASGDNGFNWIYQIYYRKLERNLVDAACGEFFSGRSTPAEFLAACQKGADEIAKDASFKKYKRS